MIKAIIMLPINLIFELFWFAIKLENKNKRKKLFKQRFQ